MEKIKLICAMVENLGESGKQAFMLYLGYELLVLVLTGVFVLLGLIMIIRLTRHLVGNTIKGEICRILELYDFEGGNYIPDGVRKRLIALIVENKNMLLGKNKSAK